MNELYAADPAVCHHASELKLLLASFGPYAGRYLANYPLDWAAQVEHQFDTLGEVEAARVKTLLRRAKESLTLVTRANLPWRTEQAWLANAMPLLCNPPAVFDGLIASTTTTQPPAGQPNSVDGLARPKPQALAIHPLDALDLPPTADERIAGIASEYARVVKILLLLSPEIALIDPYLNPLKRAYAVVLQTLFDLAAKGKCQKITLWARSVEVFAASASPAIKSDIESTLRRMAQQAIFKPGRVIELLLVADETCQNKLHDRYLLSIKGGIRIGQGFAQLPQGRQVDAGPVGKTIHNNLLDIHFDGKHDMRMTDRITITV